LKVVLLASIFLFNPFRIFIFENSLI